ncbi:C39 family peptidase [Psychrobacillus sp. FSL H8-0483]|uniref:C39 family peptidase n=1 Tax=Psychrobacillus sp. FSL H8-0483 TaxID=2921389 RepID=UPI003159B7A6
MKIQLPVQGYSQYNASILSNYQASACGPVTAYVLLNFLFPYTNAYHPNELYSKLGGTRIGLFTYRLVRNMRKLLGPDWLIEKCSLKSALDELKNDRPLALKFDKYFTFKWNKKFTFSYHWVPLIGYELDEGELFLIVHDNGGRNRESSIRKIRYADNASILTFVKVAPCSTR